MGCYPIKQLSKEDEILLQREKKIGLHNYKITEIKEKFFNLNSGNEISFEKVIVGLQFLGKNFTQAEKDHIIEPFLKPFIDENSETELNGEYNFTNLLAVFFLMSSSSDIEKGKALFRFYDDDKNCTLDKNEIERMLANLVKIIDLYSDNIVKHDAVLQSGKNGNYDQSKIFDLITDEKKNAKKIMLEKILNDLIPKIFDNNLEKQLNETEFCNKLIILKKQGIDLLSTTGFRNLIESNE